jgi:carboxyl-terminal processing protease
MYNKSRVINKFVSGALSVWGIMGLLFIVSCEKDTSLDKKSDNEWIYNTLKKNYLWNDEIADTYKTSSKGAEDYFYSLLSDNDGKHDQYNDYYYSYIEEEISTKSGSIYTTYGYSSGFHVFESTSTNVYMRVHYVLPDSPAFEAGLQRGDWVSHYNGIQITRSNYLEFQENTAAMTLTVGKITGNGFVATHEVELGAAVSMAENPIYLDTTYVINNKKIGYLVYNHFVSGPEGNDDETYNNQLRTVFSKFASEKPDAFILDLRYNPGGIVNSAQLLATMLAPQAAFGKTFCQLVFNETLNKTEDHLLDKDLIAGGANLNLDKVYVLTGPYTASSSELIINGLRPYMDVVLVGETTEGKNVGSNEFSDKNNHSWVLHPITCLVKNAEGFSDYTDGFSPNYEVNETFDATPLGDTSETLLSSALSIIDPNINSAQLKAVSDKPITLRKKFVPILIP